MTDITPSDTQASSKPSEWIKIALFTDICVSGDFIVIKFQLPTFLISIAVYPGFWFCAKTIATPSESAFTVTDFVLDCFFKRTEYLAISIALSNGCYTRCSRILVVISSACTPYIIVFRHFKNHCALDPHRHDRDWRDKKKLAEATFGWAITCHKAQGSQWENVIVWDDGLSRTEQDRRRWLYTAITRAERGLVILA